jgi:hypothetical protein
MDYYYYLEGITKKGPLTENEIIELNLKPTTLIWHEGVEDWRPISEFPRLVSKLPPSIPHLVTENFEKKQKFQNKRNYIIMFISLFLMTLFAIKLMVENKLKNEEAQYREKLELIFNNKDEISDGKYFGSVEVLELTQENVQLESVNKNELYYLTNLFKFQRGGFHFEKLKKVGNGYETESLYSTYLGLKNNEVLSSFSLNSIYDMVYTNFANENKLSFYPGTFNQITNFPYHPGITNEYFFLAMSKRPTFPFTENWVSNGNGYYSTESFTLFFKTKGSYFEIEQLSNAYNKVLISKSLICFSIYIALCLLILAIKPFK